MEEGHLSLVQRFEQGYFSRSRVWMWAGLSIIIFGLALMTVRDLNELTFINLLLTGVTPNSYSGLFGSPATSSYTQTITTETLIQHSTEQILLLAMSLFKLAIGGFIFLIVQQLVATRKHIMKRAEVSGIHFGPAPKNPFFAKLFPILLILGTDVQFINVGVLMTIWDLNALNILHLQLAGITSGVGFQQAVFIERLIGSLVSPVEMAGATLMLTGIPLGLATIVVNLRMQGKLLPGVLSSIISIRMPNQPIIAGKVGSIRVSNPKVGMMEGIVPKRVVMFTILGFVFGISGLVFFAPIRTLNVTNIVNGLFALGPNSPVVKSNLLFDGLYGLTVEQFLFLGLGVVIFAINIFLLYIIEALRAQRKFFGETLESTAGTKITPLEEPLWTVRAAKIFASIGLGLMVLNFLLAFAVDAARISGNALTDGTLSILIRNLKLSSFGFLIIGVGLNLVTIMVNLQLTARTLPNFFSKLLQYSQTGERNAENIDLPKPMSLAPWKLFYVILAGGIITILVTFPLSLIEIQSFLTWKTLQLAGNTSSATYTSALLTDGLLERSLLPIKLFGMGLMLLGVARTFGVIIGFVKARRQILSEGIDGLLTLTRTEEVKKVGN